MDGVGKRTEGSAVHSRWLDNGMLSSYVIFIKLPNFRI